MNVDLNFYLVVSLALCDQTLHSLGMSIGGSPVKSSVSLLVLNVDSLGRDNRDQVLNDI